ncbi:MAG TPA: asparagine synthase (glutamine-hydrolyzing) [Armatimonadota bacterium]|nr:asparagine synthase (glutamine-hydrolyzing) [Armatimonadota bacterium]
MCGICGVFIRDPAAAETPVIMDALRRMAGLMRRRGPDDEGFWSAPDGRAHFGFRRLSILDLSSAGHQPMISGDGRSAIVFNGEIYNFRELRQSLESAGVRFRSGTDTEALLEALNLWGVDAIPRLNGMFAFVWYNLSDHTLILARDHAGIKPLYYYLHPSGRGVAFASQYNALLQSPWGEPGPLRSDVLRLYLRLHHIPAPYGLLANTFQLEPGHYLKVSREGAIESHAWWTLPEHPEVDLSGSAAIDALSSALDRAVRRQRIADVPLGVFLSGGVDSPLVTAVARKQTGPDLKAFTIGNPGWDQDESEPAAEYARCLDLDFRLHPVSGGEAVSALNDVIEAQHEPFADFSALPTLLVSRFARQDVTVALSGDGGDEIFFGYERPLSLLRNGGDFRWPRPVRMALYGAGKYGLGPRRSSVITASSPGDYYFNVNCRTSDDDLRSLTPGLGPLPSDFGLYRSERYRDPRGLANYSRRVEFYGQLQRGLKKMDMASMRNSLEVRVPLLDRDVIEIGLRIDPFECMKGGGRKTVLRDLLARYVPRAAIPEGKLGFAVPMGEWLRGPLRTVVEETLFDAPLYPAGIFEQSALRSYWEDHLNGRRDAKWGLWTLLSLQWWAKTHLNFSARTLD